MGCTCIIAGKRQYACDERHRVHCSGRKLSFESFMKQVTGIGDPSGEFLLPDGTKADVSKARRLVQRTAGGVGPGKMLFLCIPFLCD